MRCLRLGCASASCKTADSSNKCAWKGKVLICLVTERKWVYELGEHNADTRSPKGKRMTHMHKAFCREMAEQRIRPQRIRNAMSRKFATPLTALPSLEKIQNFVGYYGRAKMENHDRVKEIEEWIHTRVFDGTQNESQTFTFSWDNDGSGKPIVGNGGDVAPFFIGLSTKALIRNLSEPSENFIFHLDATFKMNTRDFPVLVFGISDRCRSFHLVELFIVSQRLKWIYEGALRAVKHLYGLITGQELRLRNVMGDAEAGQYNAVVSVFGADPGIQFLMCFFHVLMNVTKQMNGFPAYAKASIMKDIYDIYFASGEGEAMLVREAVLRKWMCYARVVDFARYMRTQWLHGAFCNWQVHRTASGFASTNNPVEQFNRVLKRDYTLNKRLKIGMLLRELSNRCQNESSNEKSFRRQLEPQQALVRRTTELSRENLLHLGLEPESCADPVTGLPRYAVLHVVSIPAPRIKLPELGKTQEALEISSHMGANYARMEHQDMPWNGWPVDLVHQKCRCKYSFKFGTCIHLVFALRMTQSLDTNTHNVLVNHRRGEKTTFAQPRRYRRRPTTSYWAGTFLDMKCFKPLTVTTWFTLHVHIDLGR